MMYYNKKAKIICGRNSGWFLCVLNDDENTGGYIVMQSPNIDFDVEVFDDWFLTRDEVEKHFIFNNWVVEWLN